MKTETTHKAVLEIDFTDNNVDIYIREVENNDGYLRKKLFFRTESNSLEDAERRIEYIVKKINEALNA